MYNNIIFDLGGVVIDFTPKLFLLDRFTNETLEQQLFDISFGSEEWKALDRGEITRSAANEIMMEKAAQINRKYEMNVIINDWEDMLKTKDDTMRIMKKLVANGYKLYYLSNMPQDTLKNLQGRHFWKYFVDGIASCNVKMAKPDKRIYLGTLRKFGLDASKTVFIDDTPQNIEAAEAVGLKSILFKNAHSLVKELALLGIQGKK